MLLAVLIVALLGCVSMTAWEDKNFLQKNLYHLKIDSYKKFLCEKHKTEIYKDSKLRKL